MKSKAGPYKSGTNEYYTQFDPLNWFLLTSYQPTKPKPTMDYWNIFSNILQWKTVNIHIFFACVWTGAHIEVTGVTGEIDTGENVLTDRKEHFL